MSTREPTSIARFVLGPGRFLSITRLSLSTLDETRLASAHQAFSHLLAPESTVSLPWPDGNAGRLGLGLPPSRLAPEAISERIKTLTDEMRKAWEDLEPTKRRLRRWTFYVTTSTTTELCWVVPESLGDDIARAGLYGALVSSTFTPAALQQARESEPRLGAIPRRFDPLVQQMCDDVFAAAPAFVCSGRLDGAAAEFADYFAIAMLRDL
jgi:hypothetical protein